MTGQDPGMQFHTLGVACSPWAFSWTALMSLDDNRFSVYGHILINNSTELLWSFSLTTCSTQFIKMLLDNSGIKHTTPGWIGVYH